MKTLILTSIFTLGLLGAGITSAYAAKNSCTNCTCVKCECQCEKGSCTPSCSECPCCK
ncbi:MAG: hypothetical protein SGI98_04820 [Verrucomicrobiota bacterium]|nr:hypothetical protein [Verrucomicrobiota bacterium]